MTYSSIDPREMHRLGAGVQTAGRDLADCAAQLRGLMDMLGVGHPGVAAIDRAGRWLTDQAPDLYRRRDLAYEAEGVRVDVFGHPVAGAVVPPGKVRIHESRLIPAEARVAAALAAPLFQAAANGDAAALKQLAAHRERMSDPGFATALVEELGPQLVVTLPALMAQRVRKALAAGQDSVEAMRRDNGEVLKALSTALATATTPGEQPRVDVRFLDELKRQGRQPVTFLEQEGVPGYWALGQLLASRPATPYSAWFMSTVGLDLIRWDRDYLRAHGVLPLVNDRDFTYVLAAPADTRPFADSAVPGTVDPVAALLHQARASRDGAQALLRHGDNLKYLLHDRRPQWAQGDRGEALGEAMRTAMTGADADSKRLAVLATQFVADDVKPSVSVGADGTIQVKEPSQLDALSGIRPAMGAILAEHTDDIVSAYYKNLKRPEDGQLVSMFDAKNVGEFSPPDIDLVLLDVTADDTGYDALLKGQIAHMRKEVDEAIATHNRTYLENAITWDSITLGHVLEARKLALVARGKEADETDAAFKKLVEEGIGLVPIPFSGQVGKLGVKAAESAYEKFVQGGYAKAGDWLAKQSGHEGDKTTKAFGDASTNEKAVEQLVRQMLESSAVAHEYYRRTELDKQIFVVGDPPRIKPPHLMNPQEYGAFVDWIRSYTRVPADLGAAKQHVSTGAHDLATGLRAAGGGSNG
uniref:hypothetical protein n=1 Tax=Nonomuraea pusilla TaxID=46177 RepID=UPI0006E12F21|nr:hypothetical protein [Nonomuraea pusilla]